MKLRNTAKRVEVVAIGFMMREADQLAIAQLDEQCDVGFANGCTQVALAREGFSLGKQISGCGFGLESFTQHDAGLASLTRAGYSRASRIPHDHGFENIK